MKYLIVFLCLAMPCHAVITVGNIGSGSNLGSGTVTTGTGGASFSCASGNAVAIYVEDATGSGGAITPGDSASNSGYSAYGSKASGTQGQEQWFTNPNIATSITSANASFANATSFTGIHAYCIAGLSESPQDFSPILASGGFNNAVVGGNFTTASASEVVIIAIPLSGNATITPSGSWVASSGMPTTTNIAADIYQVFSTVQTSQHGSGTLSASANWDANTIGLIGASATPTTNAPFFCNEL